MQTCFTTRLFNQKIVRSSLKVEIFSLSLAFDVPSTKGMTIDRSSECKAPLRTFADSKRPLDDVFGSSALTEKRLRIFFPVLRLFYESKKTFWGCMDSQEYEPFQYDDDGMRNKRSCGISTYKKKNRVDIVVAHFVKQKKWNTKTFVSLNDWKEEW